MGLDRIGVSYRQGKTMPGFIIHGNCKIVIITCDDAARTTCVVSGLMGRDRAHEVDENSRFRRYFYTGASLFPLTCRSQGA
jgi:hypothetical protein